MVVLRLCEREMAIMQNSRGSSTSNIHDSLHDVVCVCVRVCVAEGR